MVTRSTLGRVARVEVREFCAKHATVRASRPRARRLECLREACSLIAVVLAERVASPLAHPAPGLWQPKPWQEKCARKDQRAVRPRHGGVPRWLRRVAPDRGALVRAPCAEADNPERWLWPREMRLLPPAPCAFRGTPHQGYSQRQSWC